MAKAKLREITKSLSNKTPKETAQTVQTPGTVMNNAGGFVYEVNLWDRLERFLIRGTAGGSYYCTEEKITLENSKNVIDCLLVDGIRTVKMIVEISDEGRAIKNDQCLFALALCASQGNPATRQFALDSLPKVARTGTFLFQFAHYVDGFRGWGNGLRNGVSNWYNSMKPSRLALQVVKYPQRVVEEGNAKSSWSHKDLLRKAHPRGDDIHTTIYKYVTKDCSLPEVVPNELRILEGANKIKGQTNAKVVASLIEEYQLPHEVVPKELANDPTVMRALIPHMPIEATIRNLNRMTAYGVLKPLSSDLKEIVNRLTDQNLISKGRIHPINVLNALKVYSQGHGEKGKLTWSPIPQIKDALNEMVYMSFTSITPSGKNILIALDISGSMETERLSGLPLLSSREASSIMALSTLKAEKNCHIVGFTSTGYSHKGCESKWETKWDSRYPSAITPLDISSCRRIEDVSNYIKTLSMGGTNCALPMMYAIENKLDVDAFVIYTDNETYSGTIKPMEALRKYRSSFNPQAKLIVAGTSGSRFSIADQNDIGSMDVVGFDKSAPAIISDFIAKPLSRKGA